MPDELEEKWWNLHRDVCSLFVWDTSLNVSFQCSQACPLSACKFLAGPVFCIYITSMLRFPVNFCHSLETVSPIGSFSRGVFVRVFRCTAVCPAQLAWTRRRCVFLEKHVGTYNLHSHVFCWHYNICQNASNSFEGRHTPFGNQLLEGVNWKKGPPWNNLTDLDECYQTFLASVRKQWSQFEFQCAGLNTVSTFWLFFFHLRTESKS